MTAAWMAYCVAAGALLGAGALALEAALRTHRRPARWAWTAALALSIAAPAAAWWMPRPPAPSAPVVIDPSPMQPGDAEIPAAAAAPVGGAPGGSMDLSSLDRPLALFCAASTAAAVLMLLVGWGVLERRRRTWRAETVDGVPVLFSVDTGPAVIGFLRGRIVLPEWVRDADDDVRALLLAHEAEHLRAGDPRLVAFGMMSVALMPWNPAAWWMLRRLRLAVEVDCDARVLARRADVRRYGALLLEVGRRASSPTLAMAAFSEPTSFLERRIRAMTTPSRPGRGLAAVPFVALCAAALAGMRALPVPDVPAPPPISLAAAGDTTPPELVNANEVARGLERRYPPLMRDAGVTGTVTVRVRVAETGAVDGVEVVSTTHEQFSEPALAALRQARFRPARHGGAAVPFTVDLPVQFQPRAPEDAAMAGPSRVPDPTPSRLPDPALQRWDTPPMPENVEAIRLAIAREYPPLLRDAGISMRADVLLRIAATGEVVNAEAVSITHPEAGAAAERALRGTRFRPARRGGLAVESEIILPIMFTPAPGNRQ